MVGVSHAGAQIENGTESALDLIVAVEVEGKVEEPVDAAEIVRIETVCSRIERVGGAAVAAIVHSETDTQCVGEFIADGSLSFQRKQFEPGTVVTVGESILVDRVHRAALHSEGPGPVAADECVLGEHRACSENQDSDD